MRTQVILVVMLFSVVYSVHAADVAINDFVNDYAGIFSEGDKAQVTDLAVSIYDSGAAQYAVVTVPSLEGVPIETYAINLAQGNLGDTEKDNGLLLLIAVEDREYRFEVGSGLEGTLNDARVGRIGREYLVPAFREGEYGAGVIAASNALNEILVNGVMPQELEPRPIRWGYLLLMLGVVIVCAIIIGIALRRHRGQTYYDAATVASTWFGRGGGGGFGGGSSGGSSFGGGGFSGGGSSGGW